MKRIGIGWTLGAPEDSAGYALNLALQAVRKGWTPTLLGVADGAEMEALQRRRLMPALEACIANRAALSRNSGRRLPFPVLQPLGDRLAFMPGAENTPGSPDIGLTMFEHVDIPAERLVRVADWPLLLASSSWGARVLRDKGLNNVLRCPAGIDLSLFHPAPRAGLFADRYLVFSGGMLGYRGGQDLLIAAFRIFHRRHPETLLVCNWACPASPSLAELDASTHVEGLPDQLAGASGLTAWLVRNGIPEQAVLNLGVLSGNRLAAVLRESDLAVFPSRCEGSTNPAAMAALACGLPTLLSANTGHLDLLGDHLYSLRELRNVAPLSNDPGKQGWGECAVEELLEAMERAYTRRSEAMEKGRAAARFMQGWSWDGQGERLLTAVERAVAGCPVPPADAQEHYAWGLNLHRAGRLVEAEQAYDLVLRHEPGHVSARGDRGNVRQERGDLRGAEADFRAILTCRPDHSRALRSLGTLLRRGGRLDESVESLRRALASKATPLLHWELAFSLLLQGRYADAWPHFNHRHAALGLRTADPAKPRWDGRSAVTGTLLVLDEQGLGDTLQFLRFLPRIPLAAGGRVIFAGKPATLAAVRRILPDTDVFSWDRPLPRSQAWAPLMSLPECLGISRVEDVPPPPPEPWLDAERSAHWRSRVRGDGARPVVGLCWRGNPDFAGDLQRSPGLAVLQPLLAVQGLRFVSLQVGPGRREIAELGLVDRLVDLGGAIEADGAQLLDTLAVLESCDYVISSCTSVLHMAGLLGRPTRALLSSRPDWRWMTERADTPWYPSLRLIRQRRPGDWSGVVLQATAELSAWRDQAILPA